MKIGLLFGSFAGGGAERMMINLAKGFYKERVDITIYVVNNQGAYKKEVPSYIKIVNLKASYGVKSAFYKIRELLKKNELDALVSTQEHVNAIVGLATIGLNNRPKVIFREANTPSMCNHNIFRKKAYSLAYQFADHHTAVSEGVKKDMIKYYGLSHKKVSVIYNPVVDDKMHQKKKKKIDHPWFMNRKKEPVIVGMGRIVPQKGFEDLIDAFALVRKKIPSKLVIFGKKNIDIDYLNMLKCKIDDLGLNDHIQFPGFVENPFQYLNRASLFVLSSKYEGLPGVLIQALACGCPVVSTDCHSGPQRILKGGEFGLLVDVGDCYGLSQAILETLNKPIVSQLLVDRGNFFSSDVATENYLDVVDELLY